jgi:hypothetical protein
MIDEVKVQKALIVLWQELTGINSVKVTDDWFAIGGRSLTALTMIARVSESYRVDLDVEAFLRTPTISHLALAIRSASTEAPHHEA